MTVAKKDQIRALLKSIETGDTEAVAVVNEARYVQHNPHTHEGSEGLADLFVRLSKTSPRVEIVRAFEDGDFVFAHTEYDFSDENVGFEVFRFEDGRAVEHWDDIQSRKGPNPSGHTMTDGPTDASDLDRTEANRRMVRAFAEDVLVHHRLEKLERSTGCSRRATSFSAWARACSAMPTAPSTTCTGSTTAGSSSTGTPSTPSRPAPTGTTRTGSSSAARADLPESASGAAGPGGLA